MKKYSANGKGSGKLGGSVYVINHGVQIEREYNGSVSNPSTSAQVGQRARFKLASQVSAALENVIAIPRKGILSPRNRFVKRNMPFFYGGVDGAQVTYENLQLTLGSAGLPSIYAERTESNELEIQMTQPVNMSVSHIAYSIFRKTDEDMLQLVATEIVPVSEDEVDAHVTIADPGGNIVIYAYGYRMKNAKAKAKYDNYRVASVTDMATLIANRRLELSDIYFTGTRGTSLRWDDEHNFNPEPNEVILYLSNNLLGTIRLEIASQPVSDNATGSYAVRRGSHIKLTQIPIQNEGVPMTSFDGWYNNGEQQPFSTNTSIEFDMNDMRDIIARWNPWTGLE